MLKRFLMILCVIVLIFPVPRGYCGYWTDDADKPVVCCEDRAGCQVMQMIMMGNFSDFDPSDSLSARIMSAAFPVLMDVSRDDFVHFCDEFSVSRDEAQRYYYIALANCLWADIRSNAADSPEENTARDILILFLDPAGQQNAQVQMDLIRENTDDALINKLTQALEVPSELLEYIIFTDNWQSAD